MVRTFIQVTALLIALVAAYFLAKGSISLSARDIAELSKTKWNYNSEVAKNLSKQQADARVGGILVFSSFILQMINLLWPMRIKDFAVDQRGVVLAICVSILFFIIASAASNKICDNTQKEISKIIDIEREK